MTMDGWMVLSVCKMVVNAWDLALYQYSLISAFSLTINVKGIRIILIAPLDPNSIGTGKMGCSCFLI